MPAAKSPVNRTTASAIVCGNHLYVAAINYRQHQLPELFLSLSEPLSSRDNLGAQIASISKAAKLKGCHWNFQLYTDQYQLLQTDVPDVPEEEVDDTLKFKAMDLIQSPLSESAIAISQFPAEAFRGRLKMAYIIAAKRAEMEDIQDQFGLQGLLLDSIDIVDMTMRNLVALASNKPCYAAFSLGKRKSSINCYFKGHLCLHRDIDIGSIDLVASDSAADAPTSGQRELSVATLTLEVQRSLDYFESQLALGAIADILVIAPEVLSEELVLHFDSAVQPRVLPLRFAETMTLAGGVSPSHSCEDAFAIGGALRNWGGHA
jgi:MSHA biogenesis protein MshI